MHPFNQRGFLWAALVLVCVLSTDSCAKHVASPSQPTVIKTQADANLSGVYRFLMRQHIHYLPPRGTDGLQVHFVNEPQAPDGKLRIDSHLFISLLREGKLMKLDLHISLPDSNCCVVERAHYLAGAGGGYDEVENIGFRVCHNPHSASVWQAAFTLLDYISTAGIRPVPGSTYETYTLVLSEPIEQKFRKQILNMLFVAGNVP